MIYFDNAATSKFKPKCSVNALKRAFQNGANGGRGSHADALKTAMATENVRNYLLQLFAGGEGYNLVFTKNCTEALNLAIFGSVIEGKHVITTALEHNSVLRPLYALNKDKLIKLTVINPDRDGSISPVHVERMINKDTYLIAVTAESNVTGAVNDISAIGKIAAKYGVMFLVDGAQAVPKVNINMTAQNIDMLALPGHKGLHGPQGTGFLVFNNKKAPRPLLYGGTGTDSDSVYQPKAPPEAYESGTLNSIGIAALGKSAEWTIKNLASIKKNIAEITTLILYGLKNTKGVTVYTPDGASGGLVSFNVNNKSSTEVGDILNEKYNIAVRSGLHCAPLIHNWLGTLEQGAVRVSAGVCNTISDAQKLLKAVREIARGK